MKRLIGLITLALLNCNLGFTETNIDKKNGLKLTCSVNGEFHISVAIAPPNDEQIGISLGLVNNKVAVVQKTESTYHLEYDLVGGDIKINLYIDRTTGSFREVWTTDTKGTTLKKKPLITNGKCKKVDPKF